MILKFKREGVQRLFEHTIKATSWKSKFGDTGEPRPGLWLVGSDGVYLMSNCEPPLLRDPDNPRESESVVVYADGCDPKLNREGWWSLKDKSFGSSDGCDFIPCIRREDDGINSVAEWLEVTVGREFVEIDINEQWFTLIDAHYALLPAQPGRVESAAKAEFIELFKEGRNWSFGGVPVNEMDRRGLVAFIGFIKRQQAAKLKQDERTLAAVEIYEKRIQALEKELKKYKPKNEKTRRPAKGSAGKRKAA